jgi:hypothetical protein
LQEIIGPLIIAGFLAATSVAIPRVSFDAIPEYNANSLFQSGFYPSKTILVVPVSNVVKTIMDHVVSDLPITATPKYEMFTNESSMIVSFRASPSSYSIGVMFDDDPLVNGSYQIRVPFDKQAQGSTTFTWNSKLTKTGLCS